MQFELCNFKPPGVTKKVLISIREIQFAFFISQHIKWSVLYLLCHIWKLGVRGKAKIAYR